MHERWGLRMRVMIQGARVQRGRSELVRESVSILRRV